MVKYFKKQTGYVVMYDSNVHNKSYLEMLKFKFSECNKDGSDIKKETKKIQKDKKELEVKDGK